MAGGEGESPAPEARSQGAAMGGGPALEDEGNRVSDEVKEGDECGEEEAAGWYKVDGLRREATELFRRWKESGSPVSSSLEQFLSEFWTFVTKGCECGCTDSGGGWREVAGGRGPAPVVPGRLHHHQGRWVHVHPALGRPEVLRSR